MRTLKFRGKRTDGYGWAQDRMINMSDVCRPTVEGFFVDPETVGQFTGLHDDVGKEIYEGDIVRVSCPNRTELAEIRWFNGGFCMIAKQWACSLNDFDGYALEITGNIHDNPELLKKT